MMPCCARRARLLLRCGKALVHRRFPFTIRPEERAGADVQPVRLKLDPGADVTGVAIVQKTDTAQAVLHPSEIARKGRLVRQRMRQRAAQRRRRCGASLRYRRGGLTIAGVAKAGRRRCCTCSR
ncbi:MAG: RRXRR domain-containing protein [Alphaproteobacteria bacterium]|nr:RRXRR domain-containing protein [Alphaproteobacteria bacterium]